MKKLALLFALALPLSAFGQAYPLTAPANTGTSTGVQKGDGNGGLTPAVQSDVSNLLSGGVGTLNLSGYTVTLPTVPIAQGGTGATTATAALANLGAVPAFTEQTVSATSGTVTIAAPTNGGNIVRVRLTATLTGALTLTLPAASAVREVRVEDEGGYSSTTNTVSVIRAGSDTVTGLTTAVQALAGYGTQTLVSDLAGKWALFNNTNNQAITPSTVTTGSVTVSGANALSLGNTQLGTPGFYTIACYGINFNQGGGGFTFGGGTAFKKVRFATATLSGGTIAVSDTAILATSQIYPSNYTTTGTPGAVFIASKTAGTGYTITSTNSGATNQVSVMIVDF